MSPSELIQVVDQQRIWGFLVGHERVGDRFLRPSWSGTDKSPDCRLGIKGNKIRYYDPSKGHNFDILDCYKLVYPNDSWQETVERVLAWNGSAISSVNLINSGQLFEPRFVLVPKVIDWSEWGIAYWQKMGVDYKILSHPKILTKEICGYEISGTSDVGDYYSSQFARGFVYYCNGKVKVYLPEAPKGKRFKGRCKPEDCWLVDRSPYRKGKGLSDTKTLLVSKSCKDMLVWLQFVSCDLMAVSAEMVFPDSNWLLTNVRMKYQRVIVVFDSDETGISGANKLANSLENLSDIGAFTTKVWNWPTGGVKDLADYRVENGYDQTLKFLKQNNFHKIFD